MKKNSAKVYRSRPLTLMLNIWMCFLYTESNILFEQQ